MGWPSWNLLPIFKRRVKRDAGMRNTTRVAIQGQIVTYVEETFTGVSVQDCIQKARQRHTRTGKNYTPTDHPVNAYKAAIGLAWLQCGGQCEPDHQVRLNMFFVLPRPKSLRKGSRVWHGKKPDIDNLLKSTKDALTLCGAWRDDSQVAMVSAWKCYAAYGEDPHVELSLERMPSRE